MGKSRRFIQQGSDAIKKHAEKFPYHLTFAESEKRKQNANKTGAQL